MMQKIRYKLLILSSLLMFAVPLVAAAGVSAGNVTTDIENSLCGGSNIDLSSADCNVVTNGADTSLSNLIRQILNVLSLIVGAIAVVMIIIGGFRYVASGGKQESVSGAKNTIMYALIGLVIVALAQIVVRFVLRKTTDAI